MTPTSLNTPTTESGDAPVLAAATPHEKTIVLDRLLMRHPDLVEEADELATSLISSTTADEVAGEVAYRLGSPGIEELASRVGRIPGRGYVHETDAAWELLEEALEPTLIDIRRRADLGLVESATSVVSGAIVGLRRLRGAADGQLIAFAGDDAIDTLTETVRRLADGLQLEPDDVAS